MFTLGTSAIKELRKLMVDQPDVYNALGTDTDPAIWRLVAFVGTAAEQANTFIAPYGAYFVLNADNTQAQLSIPQDSNDPTNIWPLVPNQWQNIGLPFDQTFIKNYLKPAGGFANALYAFQRGNYADMGLAQKFPGLPYYSRDTEELFMYDENRWISLSNRFLEIGVLLNYPEVMGDPPRDWLRCTGDILVKAAYKTLYDAIGERFNDPYVAIPLNSFMIPKQSGSIIRYN
jgi:hypothetical protein